MAKNKNFSNALLENIDREIPITSDLITLSKETAEIIVRRTSSKSPIKDSSVDISKRFTNCLQQQVLFLQTELKNKDGYIKSLPLQLSKQSDIIYFYQNQRNVLIHCKNNKSRQTY